MIDESFLPMLAVRGQPFDSPEYLFEVKWNGVRALAARDPSGWRLWGRDQADYRSRYPELEFLKRLPQGTVVDGEIVRLRDGLPDLDAILGRHQLTQPQRIRDLSGGEPVTYVVFDAVYSQGRSLCSERLQARRAALHDLVLGLPDPRWVFSEGMVGCGRAFFEQAVRQGQEGIMAKHLASGYLAGRRSSAWRKIKPARSLVAVIIGYVPGRFGVRRLLVATAKDGPLRYVAMLQSGFTGLQRSQLATQLAGNVRVRPVVPCSERAVWVEPELYCEVRFLEWTCGGRLRGASFARLLQDASATRPAHN
jgi:ATP-dependent DNA ligase